jgi:hypothetical protein
MDNPGLFSAPPSIAGGDPQYGADAVSKAVII